MIIYICLMAVMAYLAFRWGKETKAGTCHMMKEYTEKKEMAEQVGNLLQFVGKCAYTSTKKFKQNSCIFTVYGKPY